MILMDNSVDSKIHDHGFDPPVASPVIREEWTEHRITLLKDLRASKLFTRGAIAKIINEQTGSRFSKGAICGKIDRLFPIAHPVKSEAEKLATRTANRDRHNAKLRDKRRTARIDAGLPVDMNRRRMARDRVDPQPYLCQELPDVVPLNLSLMELTEKTCRWPYGDSPAVTFCGHEPVEKRPYCRAHCAISYQPPKPSTRAPYIERGRAA